MMIDALGVFIGGALGYEIGVSPDYGDMKNLFFALSCFLINSLPYGIDFLHSFLKVVDAEGRVNELFHKLYEITYYLVWNTPFFKSAVVEGLVNFIRALCYFIYRNEISDSDELVQEFTMLIINYCKKWSNDIYMMRALILLFRRTAHVDSVCSRILLHNFETISDPMFRDVENENFEEFLYLIKDMLFSTVRDPTNALALFYRTQVFEVLGKLESGHSTKFMEFIEICGSEIFDVLPP